MKSFIKRPEGKELTEEDIANIVGKPVAIINLSDVISVLKSYNQRNIKVYNLWCGEKILKSEEVDKYTKDEEGYNYIDNNCYAAIKVYPIVSLEAFEKEVENLGDWRNPENQFGFCKIMLQLVSMYSGYNINLELEDGIKGEFHGNYPEEFMHQLYEIIRGKFPTSDEIFNDNGRLRPEFEGEDSEFYYYLGNFSNGASVLAERLHSFFPAMHDAGLRYDDSQINIDIIRNMKNQGQKQALKV